MSFVQISRRILEPRLPELGHIKIGGKGQERTSGGGKKFRLPEKYDHFVITKRERGRDDNYVRDDAVHASIGAEPKELDVRLLWDQPGQNWQSFLAAYDGRTRRCWGNGETAEDAEHGQIPCTCPWFKQHEGGYGGPARPVGRSAPTCKPHGRLSLILEAAEAFGGYYVFRTTSWETISNISSQLELFQNQFGFLAGLPLKLVIYAATDNYQEGGQAKTSTSWKVALVLRGSFDTARQIAAAAYERRSQLALPSPAQAETHQRQMAEAEQRETADVAAEFHPETFVDGDVVDADVEPLDEEADRVERVCRYALEMAGWEQERVNRQVAKFSDRIEGLAEKLRESLPAEFARALEELSVDDAPGEAAEEPDALPDPYEVFGDGGDEAGPDDSEDALPAPAPGTPAAPRADDARNRRAAPAPAAAADYEDLL